MYEWELRKEPDIETVVDRGYVSADDIESALLWARAAVGLSNIAPELVEHMPSLHATWARWPSGTMLRVDRVNRPR
ncbi:unnamed protein product [marine sediment metagenome]|uniref:Uncharacterized protein n=1 Tax=marine sediment metagenome TaxID=412755 RepID=X1QJL6_9ZZZZ